MTISVSGPIIGRAAVIADYVLEGRPRRFFTTVGTLDELVAGGPLERLVGEQFALREPGEDALQTLTRELGLELIEYVTVGAYTPNEPREINIYYKFLDKPLNDKKTLYSDENA